MMGEAAVMPEGLVGLEAEVTQLRRGEPDAFAALLLRYQNRLYRYLLRLVREPAAAEDLFQHTWLRVIENIRSYDPGRSFEAWLFRVARNLTIDHLRRHRPESLDEELPSGEPRSAELPDGGPSVLDGILQGEQSAHLAAALGRLPAIHREVLTLRFEEEMKLEEMAEVLGVPLSTVKSRLRRALGSLRQKLQAQAAAG